MQRDKAACSRSHTWQCLQAQSNCTLRLMMWTGQCIPSLEQSPHYSNTTTYTLANTAHPKIALTWKVCSGCWGPRLHSEQECGYHHAGASASHNVEYGSLDKVKEHELYSVLSAEPSASSLVLWTYLPSCKGVWEPYMGVREPEPYMGV